MKSKVYTISASGLNGGSVQEIDVSLNITNYVLNGNSIVENVVYYPSQILISNQTNKTIGYVILSSSNEEQIYTQHPEWFDFIPIKSKVDANALSAPKSKKVLLKNLQTNSTGTITIICINYFKT